MTALSFLKALFPQGLVADEKGVRVLANI